ncbi:Y-family DNA polymerase [Roseateles violae]|uniref:DNA polymerase Y family protein n=1 Tax=Roseateles violae TaxID=3058042 RepID=A0ABT8DY80_9BURK|nr:DNA polymerase Y family protein [Pelomonas sp. PFR6]MDN3922214.1 DNA polymerase Y family protein [Pelomonas sp. PFR6]
MYWLALLPQASDSAEDAADTPQAAAARQQALAWLALRFSPRVACLEEAVVLEVGASLRLFGGARALHRLLRQQAAQSGLALRAIAWAPSSLGALALARAGIVNGLGPDFHARLDALPLASLSAVAAQQAMLARLGCRCLADVRRLPRPAAARRFGSALLQALDQAYGEAPEAHRWLELPERFAARLELPWRVEHAPALLHYLQQLLRQLCAWLAARHAGIREFDLHWQHDAMRARDSGSGGTLRIATAETTRDFGHLSRLAAEHLAQLQLAAPAGELSLSAEQLLPLQEHSASLLPRSPEQAAEPLPQLLERLSVRLGRGNVREGRRQEDHRLERMQRWLPWPVAERQAGSLRRPPGPQPSWLLEPPQRLAVSAQEQPLAGGPLQLLAGPHRIEAGWWDGGAPQQRDYFLYRSAELGLLWIYSERQPTARPGWFLHGVFG